MTTNKAVKGEGKRRGVNIYTRGPVSSIYPCYIGPGSSCIYTHEGPCPAAARPQGVLSRRPDLTASLATTRYHPPDVPQNSSGRRTSRPRPASPPPSPLPRPARPQTPTAPAAPTAKNPSPPRAPDLLHQQTPSPPDSDEPLRRPRSRIHRVRQGRHRRPDELLPLHNTRRRRRRRPPPLGARNPAHARPPPGPRLFRRG